jgi:DNA-binding transcriptional LysR family regulator
MNITELEYIVAIEKYGSINGAARELHVAQPNISKAVKNLESEYRIQIFQRSASGMTPTSEGRMFIGQAALILSEWNKLKEAQGPASTNVAELKVALPRATYASYTAARVVQKFADTDCIYFNIKECGSAEALKNVLENGYHMAILRYPAEEHERYQAFFERKHLCCEVIMKFNYQLLVNKDSPLASTEVHSYSQLEDYIEIIDDDDCEQTIEVLRATGQYSAKKYIRVYERGSQFEVLREVKNAYMWASPIPPEIMEQEGVVLKDSPLQTKKMIDVMIYHKGEKRKEISEFLRQLYLVADAAGTDGKNRNK